MEEEPSRSSPIAKDAIGDDAWNWRDDDWSSYLRVKNRVAQALSCYGEVPDEMLEESKEPSEEDLRIADLAAVTPAARGGGSFEDSDDENADGTADALEARARMFTPACRALPKVELHAHLNGCVRDRTLLEFAQSDDRPAGDALPTTLASLRETLARGSTPGDGRGRPRPLSECFELFGAIHALCTDHARIARVAAEAVVDFARDGVVYLELRTTPKDLEARGVSKESYCEAVLRGMALGSHVARKAAPANAAFVARLILSVDRRESVAEAKRTVRLAAYLRDTDCGVVGVDLSGDPSVGSFAKLEPALRLARKNGLPVTLHCGEAANARGEEAAMLRFKPERLGHCVFTTRDETLWAHLRASKIPVELCITSNVVTDSVDAEGGVESTPTKKSASTSAASAAARHHLTKVHGAGHPFVLATDDPGVFDTSLSREYALAAASCGLRSEDLRRIARDAFEYAFVHAHEAMNEEDAERAAGDVAKVRAALDAGTRAWPGLPAVTAADAIRESATKRASATKRRITSATREVTRRVNLFKDAVADLADVAAENDAVVEENGGDDEVKDEVKDDGGGERHAGSGTGAATSRDARVSKWGVVRAVVGGADEDEAPARSSLRFGDVVGGTLGRSVARMTKQSKKAAAATVALALLRPGLGRPRGRGSAFVRARSRAPASPRRGRPARRRAQSPALPRRARLPGRARGGRKRTRGRERGVRALSARGGDELAGNSAGIDSANRFRGGRYGYARDESYRERYRD
jgi:adenosine deaminase